MEQEYLSPSLEIIKGVVTYAPDLNLIIGLLLLSLMLFGSALMSASEVAYFSLKPGDIDKLKELKKKRAAKVIRLHDMPEKLLRTILISHNTFKIAFVLLAAFVCFRTFDFSSNPVTGFLLEAAAITMVLLFFGEIIPKVYASRNKITVTIFMAGLLSLLEIILRPATSLLIRSASLVKKRTGAGRSNIRMEELSDALELSSNDKNEDEKILKGIANFGIINVNEIMCPRIDVTAIDIKNGFNKVKSLIIESGFSRIPVYEGSFDTVKGVIYAKDILPYAGNPDTFKWQTLMRPPHFVPETKKINELLKEFQMKRNHMAIVIDEYGGTSGIITLEDVLEEIVGEITDESDEEENLYRKIDEKTFIFEGKVLLNDFCKIMEVDSDLFEDVRGESETLAGLILELTGEIPQKGKIITHHNFKFRIESADKRRIKEIRVELAQENENKRKE